MPMRGVAARDEDHAAREAVQPMHDPWPQLAAHARKCSETVQHGVDQSPRVTAGAGVNCHARWLVDGDYIGVFVQDLEWQILRAGPERRKFARLNLDALGAFQQVRTLYRRPIHQHAALLDPILQPRPAKLRQSLPQKLIEPL